MIGFSAYTPSRSGALVSGLPSPLVYSMNAVLNAPNIIASAVNRAVKDEVAIMRKELIDKGHGDIASNFDMEYDSSNNTFVYVVQGEVVGKTMELEYGTLDKAPKAVLRSMIAERANDLQSRIDDYIKEGLGQ